MSKHYIREFDKYTRLRRALIVKLYTMYSKKYHARGVELLKKKHLSAQNRRFLQRRQKLVNRANNVAHHDVLNNLRKPNKMYWKKVKGKWECDGCRA